MSGSRRNSNDKDGAGGVLGDRLSDASEEEFFQPLSTVRSEHDAVGVPFGCDFEDAQAGFAFDDARVNRLVTRGMKRFRGVKHDFFGSAAAFLQSGILFKESGTFDYVDKQHFTSPGAQLGR
jgi:hypothetical protein